MQSDVLPPPLPEKHRTGDQSELDAIIFELKMELAGIELNIVKYELIFLHECIIKTPLVDHMQKNIRCILNIDLTTKLLRIFNQIYIS